MATQEQTNASIRLKAAWHNFVSCWTEAEKLGLRVQLKQGPREDDWYYLHISTKPETLG